MPGFQPILLNVWREACRHIDIATSTELIARIIAHHLPLDRLVVLRVDTTNRCLRRIAAGLTDGRLIGHDVHPLDARQFKLWRNWAGGGELLSTLTDDAASALWRTMLHSEDDGDWVAGPLMGESGPIGALVLRALPPDYFESAHHRVIGSLLEPFAVAVENDRRLHELQTLREAAEADKRSALQRLGREQLTDTIVGGDAGLRPVLERVALVAKSDIPALILGETGSGKEVIARAIHDQSQRRNGPFIRVNCGAIPPELIDSELFGHEKGAFTGATTQRRGWFERADGGTLLLDEIGELPPPAQVRLLRVLQEGTFDRVGGEKPVHVDVRMVAATHRDLPAMIQSGDFRQDLWYRVAGFPIILPPLRERKEDIAALADHFAAKAAVRFGLPRQHPTAQDIALLQMYDWPGNIRELASVIDRAAILGDGQSLAIARALGASTVVPPLARRDRPTQDESLPTSSTLSTMASLDDAIRQHIHAALRTTRGRIDGQHGAARLLNVNPFTLRSRMKKLGIDWHQHRGA